MIWPLKKPLRPYIVHFLAIQNEHFLCFKASVSLKQEKSMLVQELEDFAPSFPLQNISLLSSRKFHLKLEFLNEKYEIFFSKFVESDSHGNFLSKIALQWPSESLKAINIYEVGLHDGLQYNLGSFLPLTLPRPFKLVICDFDKTLVDTRYHSTKELYYSLTKPVEYFPRIEHSIQILNHYIADQFHPFILSASPHFYENAIRDWLYQQKIYTAGIFLKDYRQVLSLGGEGALRPKDIKEQGFYKLNQLLNILLMTQIPSELVLMGDNFESDPIIYLLLSRILLEDRDAWSQWKRVKDMNSFSFTNRQISELINKFHQLRNLLNQSGISPKITIHIRKNSIDDPVQVPNNFGDYHHLIRPYDGHLLMQDETSSSPQEQHGP
jgi:hypothetical protein